MRDFCVHARVTPGGSFGCNRFCLFFGEKGRKERIHRNGGVRAGDQEGVGIEEACVLGWVP